MPAQPHPAVPLADALQDSQSMQRLAERVRESRQRFEGIQVLLPSSLAPDVLPGPLDEHGWTLLAGSSAVAAKLRQLVPVFDTRLSSLGYAPRAIRIHVRSL
jgi:hypothetical protein